MLIQMANTHMLAHIHTEMSAKNSHPGKRWIPQTTECMRGWGESWESRMPACSATEWADWAQAKTDWAKKKQNNTHPDLAPNRWQHLKVQRLVSAIYPHAVVGQLASRSGRHVGRGGSITGLLPSWHSLGKPRWKYKVRVTSGNACNSTKSWGPWGSGEGGPARWKRLNSTVNQGETVSGSFYLMIWQKQTVESLWLHES